MVVNSLKDLSKIIDLCRKKGIDSIEIDNVKLKLGHLEPKRRLKALESPIIQENTFTEEDILNWSVPSMDGVS